MKTAAKTESTLVMHENIAPTAKEQHLAKLVTEIYGPYLTIVSQTTTGLWRVTVSAPDSFFLYVRESRDEAVGTAVLSFTGVARRIIDGAPRGKRASKLRALLVGAP